MASSAARRVFLVPQLANCRWLPEKQIQPEGPPKDTMLVAAELLLSNESEESVVLQNWVLQYTHAEQAYENTTPNEQVAIPPTGKTIVSLVFLLPERVVGPGEPFNASISVMNDRGRHHSTNAITFKSVGLNSHTTKRGEEHASERRADSEAGSSRAKSIGPSEAESVALGSRVELGADPRRVFVVHGRNVEARNAMFTFLQAINLEPIEWNEAVSLTGEGSPFIGQILDKAFSQAKAVVVLITGDDLARLGTRFQTANDPPYEKELTAQARPNVLFEAGMAFGRHPEQTVLVSLGHSRSFSDVAGRNQVLISNRAEDRLALSARLRNLGCDVKTDNKTHWLNAGDFDAANQAPDGSARPIATLQPHVIPFANEKLREVARQWGALSDEERAAVGKLLVAGRITPQQMSSYLQDVEHLPGAADVLPSIEGKTTLVKRDFTGYYGITPELRDALEDLLADK